MQSPYIPRNSPLWNGRKGEPTKGAGLLVLRHRFLAGSFVRLKIPSKPHRPVPVGWSNGQIITRPVALLARKSGWLAHNFALRRRRALVITDTELKLMAAAA